MKTKPFLSAFALTLIFSLMAFAQQTAPKLEKGNVKTKKPTIVEQIEQLSQPTPCPLVPCENMTEMQRTWWLTQEKIRQDKLTALQKTQIGMLAGGLHRAQGDIKELKRVQKEHSEEIAKSKPVIQSILDWFGSGEKLGERMSQKEKNDEYNGKRIRWIQISLAVIAFLLLGVLLIRRKST